MTESYPQWTTVKAPGLGKVGMVVQSEEEKKAIEKEKIKVFEVRSAQGTTYTVNPPS